MEKYFKDLFKKYLKKFHVAFAPDCCEDAQKPVGYNTGDSTLQYYDSTNNTYIDIASGGTPADPNRSIQWNNNGVFGGSQFFEFTAYQSVFLGSGMSAIGLYSFAQGYTNTASGSFSHAEGYNTRTEGEAAHAEGSNTLAVYQYSHTEGFGTIASQQGAHAEGFRTYANGNYAHTEGFQTYALGNYAHAEGLQTYAYGSYSHTEGYNNSTSGNGAHAEGLENTAIGDYSHVEGRGNTAQGSWAHSEGFQTQAFENYSHSEGFGTKTFGAYSHAEGIGTYTNAPGQTVVGQFNAYNGPTFLFAVGNGVDDSNRNNMFTVSTSRVFINSSYLGNYPDNATALLNGLFPGELYRNGDIIQVVH